MKPKDSELDYKSRNFNRINAAEDKAKQLIDCMGVTRKELGFDEKYKNIPTERFLKVPTVLRKMPDFIIISDTQALFLEVKGFNGTLRIKHEDFEVYGFWNDIMPVRFFAYDFDKGMSVLPDYHELSRDMTLFTTGSYPDNGKSYFEMDWGYLRGCKRKYEH